MKFNLLVTLCLITLVSVEAFAINMSGCDTLLNNGWYKKYEYQGIDQPATKATKKHGSSIGTTKATTERSTATLDPKYWANTITSYGGYTTSTGPCAALASQDIVINRELYFAQNKEEVLKEIAIGNGEHLKVLAVFSLCDQDAYSRFAEKLQQQFEKFKGNDDKSMYGPIIDGAVSKDSELSRQCYSYSRT